LDFIDHLIERVVAGVARWWPTRAWSDDQEHDVSAAENDNADDHAQ
jgi:hypothetical protein